MIEHTDAICALLAAENVKLREALQEIVTIGPAGNHYVHAITALDAAQEIARKALACPACGATREAECAGAEMLPPAGDEP